MEWKEMREKLDDYKATDTTYLRTNVRNVLKDIIDYLEKSEGQKVVLL